MTTITGNAAAQGAADANAQQKTGLTADFDMFLKLLTTQMQNQDPLDPMDTSEYTQQLVQFSQVEQSIQQTGTLNDILARLTGQDMAQASSYIGREARFDSDVAGLSATAPATWTYVTSGTPAKVEMTITDSLGNVVRTETIDADDQGRYSWDGTKDNGTRAADGAYSLAVRAIDANGGEMAVTVNSVGIVKEVVTDGSDVMLNVNGLRFPAAGLVAVAAAEA